MKRKTSNDGVEQTDKKTKIIFSDIEFKVHLRDPTLAFSGDDRCIFRRAAKLTSRRWAIID